MKFEWATVKDGVMYIGSFGKEFTNNAGETVHTNNLWVVAVDKTGKAVHIDWAPQYSAMRAALGVEPPGYMIHEAVIWSPVNRRWFVLPRRVSKVRRGASVAGERGGWGDSVHGRRWCACDVYWGRSRHRQQRRVSSCVPVLYLTSPPHSIFAHTPRRRRSATTRWRTRRRVPTRSSPPRPTSPTSATFGLGCVGVQRGHVRFRSALAVRHSARRACEPDATPHLLCPQLPQPLGPLRGFSSAKFLPGSQDKVIIALKSEENSELDRQTTYLTVYALGASGDWRVVMDEVELPHAAKFEGLEILSWS